MAQGFDNRCSVVKGLNGLMCTFKSQVIGIPIG